MEGKPLLLLAALLGLVSSSRAQTATVVHFPPSASFFVSTRFATDGPNGYIPSFDSEPFGRSVLWSFSLESGELLDPDGLALTLSSVSKVFAIPGALVLVPGSFVDQSGRDILVVDGTDPTNLEVHGIIDFPSSILSAGVLMDAGGDVGFVTSVDSRLYSFRVSSLAVDDPDGLSIPGEPSGLTALGDERVAIADSSASRIIIVDVSDPADMTIAGFVDLPGNPTFGSEIVFADDGRTGFVASAQRTLYSFDALNLALLDWVSFGSHFSTLDVAVHGTTLACLYGAGLSFIDAFDPTDLRVSTEAFFGEPVSMQGGSTVSFSADGSTVAVPLIVPTRQVRAIDVATGLPVGAPVPVDPQPIYLTSLGATNRIAVLCPGMPPGAVWLIDGLLGEPEIRTYCDAKLNSCGLLPQIGYTGIPSVSATHGFVIDATGARAGVPGLLIYGASGGNDVPFQGGTLCVAFQGVARGPIVLSTGGTPGPSCDATFELDMNAFSAGAAGGNPQAFLSMVGQTVNAQWWGRDTMANGSFLSDGLEYLVSP